MYYSRWKVYLVLVKVYVINTKDILLTLGRKNI